MTSKENPGKEVECIGICEECTAVFDHQEMQTNAQWGHICRSKKFKEEHRCEAYRKIYVPKYDNVSPLKSTEEAVEELKPKCNHHFTRTMKGMDLYCNGCHRKINDQLSEWGKGWHEGFKDADNPLYANLKPKSPTITLKEEAVEELAKKQPCGCIVCTCENESQCQGCGSKNCGTKECVFKFHPENKIFKSPTITADRNKLIQEILNVILRSLKPRDELTSGLGNRISQAIADFILTKLNAR